MNFSMLENSSNYRRIIKSTSIFGGVQVFNILIALIRSKIIAMFLGPMGFGIAGILTSTADFISSLINMGISTSSIRFISVASKEAQSERIVKSISIILKLVRVTALIGMLVTIIFSPLLSYMSFGTYDYTYAYVWLSLSVFFQQITSGKLVVLQGLQKLRYLALANVLGSSIGLLFGIPLYFIFSSDAIAPVIVVSTLATALWAWYFYKKLNLDEVYIPKLEVISQGKELIGVGFFLSISSLITIGASYLLRIYIGKIGGLEEVGLFSAGFAIINTYVGVVFQAMSTDYYPRLSAESDNVERSNLIINRQAEISLLIIGPLICFFLVFVHWIIVIIYSDTFIGMSEMLNWAAMGIYFKTPAWAMAFIFITRAKTKLFFWNELISNFYIFILNVLGYWFMGLEGLGISFLLGYFMYFIQVFLLVRKYFEVVLNNKVMYLFSVQLIFGILVFILARFASHWNIIIIGSVLIILNLIFSFLTLRMGLRSDLRKNFNE
jgi:O-antigen/teichoic acid export membrane protein